MNTLFNYTKSTLLLLVFSLTLLGCSNETLDTLDLQENELSARNGTQYHFNTSLKGGNEVPSNESKGTGQATVTISSDETKIHFKITTGNIQNVFAVHLHMAPAGSNGGVVAPLFLNLDQPSGAANGVLVEGYITDGGNVDLSALIDAIRNGYIYVNLHTSAVPSGELRGQL